MKSNPKLELISFEFCPFVQRSVITLKQKGAAFGISFIDLDKPPEWFTKISPMGKVPVLRVNDEASIFESAVINEFVDEIVGRPLLAADPLQKALERSWIEFGSELIGEQYRLFRTGDRGEATSLKREFFEDLARLEPVLSGGKFFRGNEFSLVDAAYAPLFMRLLLSDALSRDPAWRAMPKVRRWAEGLLELPAVRDSVVPDFEKKFRSYFRRSAFFAAKAA